MKRIYCDTSKSKYKSPKDLFNDGDIIVREYVGGKTAICIFIDSKYKNGLILYLGETFSDFGGLSEFEIFGLGEFNESSYKGDIESYRHANEKELYRIIKKLNKDIYTYTYPNKVRECLDIVKNYISKLRREKINKINNG